MSLGPPTFNSVPLFSTLIAGSDPAAYWTEGVLFVPDYVQVVQTLHFNGETGNRSLFHGYPDMTWVFDGFIQGNDTSGDYTLGTPASQALALTNLQTNLAAIQTAIDQNNTTACPYYTLVDSFGTVYDNAQIRKLTVKLIHACDVGYVASILVTGVIQGNSHEGSIV